VRVADLVAEILANHGVTNVFMITGGGAMHLNDAFGRNERIQPLFCHHEQACAIAAESYGRLGNRLCAVNVTSGPGGVNALNGVYGAFVDSIGMVVVSGQVKRETMVATYGAALRQLGDQEIDIVSMAHSVCKLAEVLLDPSDARYLVEKALWMAREGRPGPVWIDIPLDVQAADVDPDRLRSFDPANEVPLGIGKYGTTRESGPALAESLASMLRRLEAAERPAVLAGAGIRLSGAHESFLEVIDKLGIPVTTGWNAHDAIWNAHRLYVGRPGTVGDRAGNFAVQNADFLLVLGSRLNIRQISYNWGAFARAAYKVMIDVDPAELSKATLSIDQPICADLNEALPLLASLEFERRPAHEGYLQWCLERAQRFPVVLPEYSKSSEPVNPYVFVQALFEQLGEGEIVVTGDGTACVVTFQAADLKPGQRLYTNSGCASMGYDLPAAIGAYWAGNGRRVICIAGDGSVMLNLQELQTIAGTCIPVKIFVLNNDGYSSIRQTQHTYFPDNPIGCDPTSGVTFPDYVAVARAFGIEARRCASHRDLASMIRVTLDGEGPQLLEVVLDPDQPFAPKLSSRQLEDGRMVSAPLEDLSPFLSRDELADNMLIAPCDD